MHWKIFEIPALFHIFKPVWPSKKVCLFLKISMFYLLVTMFLWWIMFMKFFFFSQTHEIFNSENLNQLEKLNWMHSYFYPPFDYQISWSFVVKGLCAVRMECHIPQITAGFHFSCINCLLLETLPDSKDYNVLRTLNFSW